MVRLTVRPNMTLDVYRGRKTTTQPINQKDKTSLRFCALVGQAPTVLAVGAGVGGGGGVWTFFLPPIISLFFLPLSGRRHDIGTEIRLVGWWFWV